MLITCGPGSEPIDQVRRITNFSTGKSGIILSNFFVENGHQVICLMGSGRTWRAKLHAQRVHEFNTSQELNERLELISRQEEIDVVLHAAALSDYAVEKITDPSGYRISQPKISSRHKSIHITLKQAPKVIPFLRSYFPSAKIVGWKYELPEKNSFSAPGINPHQVNLAIEKSFRQIQENRTDACVLNGEAIGKGYIFCTADREQQPLSDLSELSVHLLDWVQAPATTL